MAVLLAGKTGWFENSHDLPQVAECNPLTGSENLLLRGKCWGSRKRGDFDVCNFVAGASASSELGGHGNSVAVTEVRLTRS